jgi:hypothetical protein
MLKFVARRPWIIPLLGLALTLAACKDGGSSGGGY